MLKTFNIGVINKFTNNTYYEEILHSIYAAIHQHGANMIVFNVGFSNENSIKLNDILADSYIDGWIVLPEVNKLYIELLEKKSNKVVYVGDYFDKKYVVSSSDYQGTQLAVNHLIKNGHENIVFIGYDDKNSERFQGYKKAMEDNSIYKEKLIYFYEDSEEELKNYISKSICKIKKNHEATAFVTSDEFLACKAFEIIQKNDLNNPSDISIIAYKAIGDTLNNEHKLSLVKADISGIGFEIVKLLLSVIKETNVEETKKLVHNQLVINEEYEFKNDYSFKDSDLQIQNNEKSKDIIISKFEKIFKNIEEKNLYKIPLEVPVDYDYKMFASWNKTMNRLLIKEFLDKNSNDCLKEDVEFQIKDFPINKLINKNIKADDIIWVYFIYTEKADIGILAFNGPFNNYSNIKEIKYLDFIFKYMSKALNTVKDKIDDNYKKSLYKSVIGILDSGILMINKEFIICDCFNLKLVGLDCQHLYGLDFKKIITKNIEHDYLDQIQNDFKKIFELDNEKEIELQLTFLPSSFIINGQHLLCDYHLYKYNDEYRIIIVLNNKLMETIINIDTINSEKEYLKMFTKIIINNKKYEELIKDYKNFVFYDCKEIIKSRNEENQKVDKIADKINSFSERFLELEMVMLSKRLISFNDKLLRFKNDKNLNSILKEYIFSMNFIKWIELEEDKIKSILGNDCVKYKNIVMLSDSKLIEIEKKIVSRIINNEAKLLLPEVRRLRYRTFKEMLLICNMYISELSNNYLKKVEDLEINGGAFFVDSGKVYNFIKSMYYLFKYIIEFIIELPKDRYKNGKSEFGKIILNIEKTDEDILIKIICDENRKQGKIAIIENSNCSNSKNIVINNKDITILENEVNMLGGCVKFRGENVNNLETVIKIPLRQINRMDNEFVRSLCSVVLSNSFDLFKRELFFKNVEVKDFVKIDKKEIYIKEYNTYISFSGIVSGLIIFSGSVDIVEKLVDKYVLEKLKSEEKEVFMEEILAECISIIFEKTVGLFNISGNTISLNSPVSITNSNNSKIKYTKSNIWETVILIEGSEVIIRIVISRNV